MENRNEFRVQTSATFAHNSPVLQKDSLTTVPVLTCNNQNLSNGDEQKNQNP